jgi:hypothetical protein
MEQGTPGHFEFQRRNGEGCFPNNNAWVIVFEVRRARWQRHNQVVLLSQSHRRLIMPGKNAYLSLLT